MRWEAPEIWNESDCFIIGGGHSITKMFDIPPDLIPIRKEEFIEFGTYLKPFLENKNVIGVNLSAFLGDWVDVAYWGDTDTYLHYKGWFDDYGGLKVASAGKFMHPKYQSIKCLEKVHKNGLCTNRKSLTWAGFNSGAAAINLAYYFGAKRIFLLGFDMYSLPEGRIHWHAGYPDKKENFTNRDAQQGKVPKRTKTPPPYKKHLKGFEPISKAVQGVGLEVINLSPKSKVKQFPVASFWDYFDDQGKVLDVFNAPKIESKKENDVITLVNDENENEPIKNESDPGNLVNFVCVLKSGGDFDQKYVLNLRYGIEENYLGDFNFYCLTDTPLNKKGIIDVPLKHNWPGWWSKIELFRPDVFNDFCIYFDLDTIILDNIDEFVKVSKKFSFAGLMGFNLLAKKSTKGSNFASGIMVGDFSDKQFIYDTFKEDSEKYIDDYRFFGKKWKCGDQGFISDLLGSDDIPKLQDFLPFNYIIGKRHTKLGKNQIPNSHILAWSGDPRIHKFNQGWVHDVWSKN